jgi:hypothetical protein
MLSYSYASNVLEELSRYWDVIEVGRKLYLVSIVAFFSSGSMMQIALSVFISVIAFSYHCYARPFRDAALNMLQGACLYSSWSLFLSNPRIINLLIRWSDCK